MRVAIGERLPFADRHFDAVLASLVIQLMDDRVAGVREMARVARPGATVTACVWDSRTMPLLRSFWDAALEVAPERAGAIDDGRRVGYERQAELGTLFETCGLTGVTTGELLVDASYQSFDELFRPFAAGVGHSGACFTSIDKDQQVRLREGAHRRVGSPEGSFTLTARAWTASGIRSETVMPSTRAAEVGQAATRTCQLRPPSVERLIVPSCSAT